MGPVLAARLLREFGSVEGVRQAELAELQRVAGRRAAEALVAHYRPAGSGDEPAPDGSAP